MIAEAAVERAKELGCSTGIFIVRDPDTSQLQVHEIGDGVWLLGALMTCEADLRLRLVQGCMQCRKAEDHDDAKDDLP